jgi:hypothetical protein
VFLWQTAAGRTLIAHCPDRYCRVDIEDMVGHVELARALEDPCHLDELDIDTRYLVSTEW